MNGSVQDCSISRGLHYNEKSMLKSMLVNDDLLTWLLIGGQLCCQAIRSQVWKFLLTWKYLSNLGLSALAMEILPSSNKPSTSSSPTKSQYTERMKLTGSPSLEALKACHFDNLQCLSDDKAVRMTTLPFQHIKPENVLSISLNKTSQTMTSMEFHMNIVMVPYRELNSLRPSDGTSFHR